LLAVDQLFPVAVGTLGGDGLPGLPALAAK